MVPFENGITVNDLVIKSCEKRHLQPVDHFLMLLSDGNESGLMGIYSFILRSGIGASLI